MEHNWPTDPGDSPPWAPPGWSSERHPEPTPDPEGGSKRNRPLVWIGAVCVVLLLASASIFALVGRDSSNDEQTLEPSATSVDQTPDTSDESPSSSTEPSGERRGAGGTGNPEVDRVLEDISRFVENERGLEFKGPVEVELVDDATFEARLLEDFEEDSEELARTAGQLRALGLLEHGVDLASELRGLLGAGVLGFYDPETGELVVRGTDLTPYTRQTVAHELTHAIDDQWFDLDRPELDDATDETGFGFSALVEGNARRVENAYTNSMTAAERRELRNEETAFAAGADFSRMPEVLVYLIMAPYELGQGLVADILDHGGGERLDLSFENPPTTSEQVIHPARFLAGEKGVTVTTPPADGTATEEGVLGEMVIRMILASSLDAAEAQIAAEGWGGDRYVTWEQSNGATCMRDDIVMDTRTDLSEVTEALRSWASGRRGAKVEQLGETVRLTTCA